MSYVSGFNLPLATTASGILLVLQTWHLFRRQLPGGERDQPIISQNAMVLPIPLSSFLEGSLSFSYLKDAMGELDSLPFKGKLCSSWVHLVRRTMLANPSLLVFPIPLPHSCQEAHPQTYNWTDHSPDYLLIWWPMYVEGWMMDRWVDGWTGEWVVGWGVDRWMKTSHSDMLLWLLTNLV